MDKDLVAFKIWLDAYGQAWENHNPETAAALFNESGTYQVTPFSNLCARKKSHFRVLVGGGPNRKEY
jgi:hypothetical protein